ncbi:MAG: DUF3089 domain-containing protein [Bacteroidota bacterium]
MYGLNRHYKQVIYLFFLLFLASCSGSNILHGAGDTNPGQNRYPEYADLYFWAAHPHKKDFSDSIPLKYKAGEKDSSVDVFFIHPTTYVASKSVNELLLDDPAERNNWNAPILNEWLNKKTDQSSILFQASAFNQYRVFAPRYRQAHYKAFYLKDSVARPFFDTAYEDVKNAFRFYLKNYNQGRPFIIASHSQGTLHAGRLIKELVENTTLANKMVAAYIIGLPVPVNYFANCKPCSTANQVNCFVSWRTFRNNFVAPYVAKEKIKAVVVNPLTWTLDTLPASKKLNRGAVLFKFNKPKKHAVSATVSGNVLWSSKPHFFGSIFYTSKNYHVGDINLFWKNIRDNVEERVNAYKRIYPE